MRADEKIEGDRAFRIPGGYTRLIDLFGKRLSTAGVPVHLNTVVREVRWSDRKVTVNCHTDEGHKYFSAPRVLLTVPLGVLQLPPDDPGALHFIPDLPQSKKGALSRLAMGKAMRVTLQFRERFWERVEPMGSKTLGEMRFLFSRRKWFPTWWTVMPERRPLITGWAPFHDAEELSGHDAAMIFSSACQTLGGLLHLGEQQVEDLVESAAFHDWQTDPFSRGAYSYVKVGGDSAQADLATPVDHTLFFAGEAADVSGYHGTVHGAIASGRHAAQRILDK
jgi:monoamine oxidase